MKNFIILLIISTGTLMSCKKIETTNPLLGNQSDKMSGRIATVTNNMQTKYGTFTGAASAQGIFKADLNITSFKIGGYEIEKKPTGMFFNSTSGDKNFEQKFITFYGNPMQISLNGFQIENLPAVPFANVITLNEELVKWRISKVKGITLNWTIRNLLGDQGNITNINSPSNVLHQNTLALPSQVSGAVTVVAIRPSDLQHTTGVSNYWIVNPHATTFTINPSELSKFSPGENIDITIGTGTNSTYYLNKSPIDMLSINSTNLPNIEIIN